MVPEQLVFMNQLSLKLGNLASFLSTGGESFFERSAFEVLQQQLGATGIPTETQKNPQTKRAIFSGGPQRASHKQPEPEPTTSYSTGWRIKVGCRMLQTVGGGNQTYTG